MSASDVIRRCREVGVRIRPNGDRLHVEAPAGAVSPDLRRAMAEHKATILAIYAARARLLEVAMDTGIPARIVTGLPPEELEATAEQLAACKGHLDRDGNPLAARLLHFYLHALTETKRDGIPN